MEKTAFKTRVGTEFTVERLGLSLKRNISRHLHSIYASAPAKDVEGIDTRLDLFAKSSFAVTFKAAEAEFGLVYHLSHKPKKQLRDLSEIVKRVQHSKPPDICLKYLFYNEDVFHSNAEQAKAILEAIRKNLPPGAAALVTSKKGDD